jgi:hypothetical protein
MAERYKKNGSNNKYSMKPWQQQLNGSNNKYSMKPWKQQ